MRRWLCLFSFGLGSVLLVSCDSVSTGPDETFGTSGIVITSVGSSHDRAYSVAIQADNRILVAGTTLNTVYEVAVVRYLEDGSLDTSFSTDGKLTLKVGSIDDRANAVVPQPDGKILVCGYTTVTSGNTDFLVARLESDGSLDTSFGSNGIFSLDLGGGKSDTCQSLKLDNAGKPLAAGYGSNGSNLDGVILRLTTSGTLDPSFDNDGKLLVNLSTNSEDRFDDIELDSSRKIVVAGASTSEAVLGGPTSTNVLVSRYLTDGSLDSSFGTLGVFQQNFSGGTDRATSLEHTSSGDLIVGGTRKIGSGSDILLFRLTPTGTLDSAFATQGVGAFSVITTAAQSDILHDLTVSPTRITIAGTYYQGSHFDYLLGRFLEVGTPDVFFGSSGYFSFDQSNNFDEARSITTQTDGKIVSAGSVYNGTHQDIAVVRYNQ